MNRKHHLMAAFCILLATAAPPSFAGCTSASCSINTSWDAQGVAQQPGFSLDLRFEFIDQNQLRAGSSKTSGADEKERQIRTLNRNFVANLDYAAENWGVMLSLPVANRSHAHEVNEPPAPPETETWKISRVGDARVVGRYKLPADMLGESASGGITFGLKLPTGVTNFTNDDGVQAERSLQPGTGSTDTLLGAYFSHDLSGVADSWFVQSTWQHAVSSKDGYRPGDQISADIGLRAMLTNTWSGMLQMNATYRKRDSGVSAESADSGGKFVYLSPGLTYAVARDSQVYAFAQLPIYQYVNGAQLTSDWALAVGFRHSFQ
ncbi:hypothetical protein [Thiobacillus sp.]